MKLIFHKQRDLLQRSFHADRLSAFQLITGPVVRPDSSRGKVDASRGLPCVHDGGDQNVGTEHVGIFRLPRFLVFADDFTTYSALFTFTLLFFSACKMILLYLSDSNCFVMKGFGALTVAIPFSTDCSCVFLNQVVKAAGETFCSISAKTFFHTSNIDCPP